jgi:hypothetical protein
MIPFYRVLQVVKYKHGDSAKFKVSDDVDGGKRRVLVKVTLWVVMNILSE